MPRDEERQSDTPLDDAVGGASELSPLAAGHAAPRVAVVGQAFKDDTMDVTQDGARRPGLCAPPRCRKELDIVGLGPVRIVHMPEGMATLGMAASAIPRPNIVLLELSDEDLSLCARLVLGYVLKRVRIGVKAGVRVRQELQYRGSRSAWARDCASCWTWTQRCVTPRWARQGASTRTSLITKTGIFSLPSERSLWMILSAYTSCMCCVLPKNKRD